ncbi:MAG TPA: hypothetical protein VF883_02240 [Thermoanaerobaculia bacterium]|jgi:hypothetical protein
MSAALLDYEPLSSASGLRPSRPKVQTYSYIQDRPAVTFVAPAVLPLFSFVVAGANKALRHPLLLRVAIEQGEYFVENDALRIFGVGRTLQEAVKSFSHDLGYFWEYYRELGDDQVAGEAVALKKRYAELVA